MTIEVSCNFVKVGERIANNIIGIIWFLAFQCSVVALLAPWTITDVIIAIDDKTVTETHTETLYTLANGKSDDLKDKLESAQISAYLLTGVALFVFYGETLLRSDSKEPSTISIWGTFILYLISSILALIPLGIVNQNKEELLGEADTFTAIVAAPGQAAMGILAGGSLLLTLYYFAFEGVGQTIIRVIARCASAIRSKEKYIPINY